MGEAIYYGKLIFDTNEHASEAEIDFIALCEDICNSQNFWQDNRGLSVGGPKKKKVELTDAQFFRAFAKRYPLAADYVKSIKHGRHGEAPLWGGTHNNSLAGLLEPIGALEDTDAIFVHENEIRWNSEVWHFADWDPFIAYCVNHFKGCQSGGWLSDEWADVNYYDMIEVECTK